MFYQIYPFKKVFSNDRTNTQFKNYISVLGIPFGILTTSKFLNNRVFVNMNKDVIF